MCLDTKSVIFFAVHKQGCTTNFVVLARRNRPKAVVNQREIIYVFEQWHNTNNLSYALLLYLPIYLAHNP